ncbi:MAG: helix-turn-helix domain-containing protein [Methylotenera sp.]|jgi:transcriptional regulator with XRE-family HTH domain
MSDSIFENEAVVSSTREIGLLIRQVRNEVGFKQLELAGMFGSGNRFIVDAEKGKESIQAQKLIDLLGLLGLEVVIRKK